MSDFWIIKPFQLLIICANTQILNSDVNFLRICNQKIQNLDETAPESAVRRARFYRPAQIIISSVASTQFCLYANSEDPDQTLLYAVSDLVLHCLPMSHENDAMLIWVNYRYLLDIFRNQKFQNLDEIALESF